MNQREQSLNLKPTITPISPDCLAWIHGGDAASTTSFKVGSTQKGPQATNVTKL